MRKHVKPADPKAVVPDPERRRDLPSEGYEVAWSVHWARLAARGDIIVSDVSETEDAPAAQVEDPAPTGSADPEAPKDTEHHPDA